MNEIMSKAYPYFLIFLIICILFLLYWFRKIIFNTGFKLIKQGEYEKAIDKFQKQMEKDLKNGSNFYGLGWCYYMLGFSKPAITNFQISSERRFREVESHLLMAILYSEENLFSEALKNIEKGKKIQKKKIIMDKLTEFEINEMIGWVYFNEDDIKTAFKYYEKAIPKWNKYLKKIGKFNLGEKFSPVNYRIGIIFMTKREFEKAKKYFEYSIKSSPNSIFAEKSRKELIKLNN